MLEQTSAAAALSKNPGSRGVYRFPLEGKNGFTEGADATMARMTVFTYATTPPSEMLKRSATESVAIVPPKAESRNQKSEIAFCLLSYGSFGVYAPQDDNGASARELVQVIDERHHC